MSFGEPNLNAVGTLKILIDIISIKLLKGEFKILEKKLNFILIFTGGMVDFTLFNAKHGESIVIGLAASSTSMSSQVKTTEPMVSIKVTNFSRYIFNYVEF